MMRKFYSAVLFSLFGFLLAVAPIAAQTSATQSTTQIEQGIDSILSRMTLQQKIDMLGGVDDFYIRDFPDLNLLASRWPMGHSACATTDPRQPWPAGSRLQPLGILNSPSESAPRLAATLVPGACTSCWGPA